MGSAERHVWEDVEAARNPRGWPLEQIVKLLASADITACELIPWGSNYTFAVKLDCEGETGLAVYKPVRGEAPLWDFPRGTLYKREYAAYLVSHLLTWDFVPPTIIRDGPHGVGSVQLYIEPVPEDYFGFHDRHLEDLQRICLFDVITNNADRKAGHCLKGTDGRIWGIDHGLTFNVQPKLRTVIWDFGGEAIPDRLQDELRDFRTDSRRIKELYATLGGCLAKEELSAFLKRIDAVLDRPVYPSPYSRRAVPWPLY